MTDPRSSSAYKRLRSTLQRAYAKKNAPCHICGDVILYGQRDTDDSLELDHVYSVQRFPEKALDPRWIRPAHRVCNRERGDRQLQVRERITHRSREV